MRLTFLAVALAIIVTGCDANGIDYPDPPPVPPGATVVATDEGADDDDPMRGREAVIDLGDVSAQDLVAFYRERFPSSDGWTDGTGRNGADTGGLLCLVNHSEGDYDRYVEIYPYLGGGRLAGPNRYLVWTSRLHVPGNDNSRSSDRCGDTAIWLPITP